VSVEQIFAKDEMKVRQVRTHWTPAELLQSEGIFFLKDMVGILELRSDRIKRIVRELQANGESPYRVVGVRKVWSHWLVRMSVFRHYYAKHLAPTVRQIQPDWNANRLLSETGRFLLADVCKLLPFTTHQLRYQSKNHPNARAALGVWKDPDLGAFRRCQNDPNKITEAKNEKRRQTQEIQSVPADIGR